MPTCPKSQGFTLIEVMVVVAIIAILAAIAIPNYNEYVTKARISEAVSTLSDFQVRMEQYFQDNRTYVGACSNGGTVADKPASTAYFDFDCTNPAVPTATAYTAEAVGKGKMAGFTYTINQSNARNTSQLPAGWSGANNNCWVLNKSGGC